MKRVVRFNHMGPQFAVEDVGKAVGFYHLKQHRTAADTRKCLLGD